KTLVAESIDDVLLSVSVVDYYRLAGPRLFILGVVHHHFHLLRGCRHHGAGTPPASASSLVHVAGVRVIPGRAGGRLWPDSSAAGLGGVGSAAHLGYVGSDVSAVGDAANQAGEEPDAERHGHQ